MKRLLSTLSIKRILIASAFILTFTLFYNLLLGIDFSDLDWSLQDEISNIDDLEGRIDDLESRIDDQESRIDDLEGRVDNLEYDDFY